MGFFSRAFLVFLMNESKKRRQKQPGKLMAKSRSQPVNFPGARHIMNPLHSKLAKNCIPVASIHFFVKIGKLHVGVHIFEFAADANET